MSESLISWLALFLTPGLGPAGCHRLVEHFGSARQVLAADRKAFARVHGIKPAVIAGLGSPTTLAAAEKECRRAEADGALILAWTDDRYPALLRHIHNPPPLLWTRGRQELLAAPAVGVVGARAASSYGLRVAERLGRTLSDNGIVVVSGLALGIDAAAHRGALAGPGGTIAVLGCGIDIPYPPQNIKIHAAIAANGLILSECPFGTKPEGFRFPLRNRIISGLCLGVVIVEAAQKSGSLITANFALDQGREVFAVPGSIDSRKSDGTHRLLQEGAKLVHTIEDIYAELPMLPRGARVKAGQESAAGMGPAAERIYRFLDAYPKSIDEIIRGTGMAAAEAAAALLDLELAGRVKIEPGRQYLRVET